MNASYLENVCFYLAARKVGAIFIPVNVRLVAREVEYIVINSDTEYWSTVRSTKPWWTRYGERSPSSKK